MVTGLTLGHGGRRDHQQIPQRASTDFAPSKIGNQSNYHHGGMKIMAISITFAGRTIIPGCYCGKNPGCACDPNIKVIRELFFFQHRTGSLDPKMRLGEANEIVSRMCQAANNTLWNWNGRKEET